MELDGAARAILDKRVQRTLTLCAKHGYDHRLVLDLLDHELRLALGPRKSGILSSLVRDLGILFSGPFISMRDKAEEIMAISGYFGFDPHPTGTEVESTALVPSRPREQLYRVQVLSKSSTVLPWKSVPEDTLIEWSRLALGPKSLYLSGQTWHSKDPLLRDLPKRGHVQRVSKSGQVLGLRHMTMLMALKKVFK